MPQVRGGHGLGVGQERTLVESGGTAPTGGGTDAGEGPDEGGQQGHRPGTSLSREGGAPGRSGGKEGEDAPGSHGPVASPPNARLPVASAPPRRGAGGGRAALPLTEEGCPPCRAR